MTYNLTYCHKVIGELPVLFKFLTDNSERKGRFTKIIEGLGGKIVEDDLICDSSFRHTAEVESRFIWQSTFSVLNMCISSLFGTSFSQEPAFYFYCPDSEAIKVKYIICDLFKSMSIDAKFCWTFSQQSDHCFQNEVKSNAEYAREPYSMVQVMKIYEFYKKETVNLIQLKHYLR